MTEPVHMKQLFAPWLTRATSARCEAALKNGEQCGAVAVRKSDRRWLCSDCVRNADRKKLSSSCSE